MDRWIPVTAWIVVIVGMALAAVVAVPIIGLLLYLLFRIVTL